MGFFDKLRNLANRLIGRAETPPEPLVDPVIMEKFGVRPQTQESARTESTSILDRAKSFFSNVFKRTKQPEIKTAPSLRDLTTELGKRSKREERQKEIFEYRRTSERDDKGRAFYRLTQSIWDRPGITIEDRDKAIRDYFKEKYGLTNMNDIYDKVLSDNAEKLEAYNNAPNAEKYTILKNIDVATAAL